MKRLALVLTLALVFSAALGHETVNVGEGDGAYRFVLGYAVEPPFTEQRNGFDIIVTRADGSSAEGLASSLVAKLIAPDGETTKEFTLRERHGQPGRYTSDFVLTQPGVYTLVIEGFVGSTEVDISLELHEVRPFDELRFP